MLIHNALNAENRTGTIFGVGRLRSFAKEHLNWTQKQCSKFVFTDEYIFNRIDFDRKVYVRRSIGEEYDPMCVKSMVKEGRWLVIVWGATAKNGTGPIFRIEGIMDQHVYLNMLTYDSSSLC